MFDIWSCRHGKIVCDQCDEDEVERRRDYHEAKQEDRKLREDDVND